MVGGGVVEGTVCDCNKSLNVHSIHTLTYDVAIMSRKEEHKDKETTVADTKMKIIPKTSELSTEVKLEVPRTKSIMSATGSTGAVVCNTPETGLKRAPTVTFSQSENGDTNESTAKSPQIEDPNTTQQRELTDKSFVTLRDKLEITKIKDERNVHNSGETIVTPKSMFVTGNNNTATPKLENEHAHFVVQDPLHSPPHNVHTGNSSIATSPRGSIVSSTMNTIKHKEHEAMVNQLANSESKNDMNPSDQTETTTRKETKTPAGNFFQDQDDGKLHVLLGCTGIIHVPKIKLFIRKLEDIYSKDKISFKIVLTKTATISFNKRKIPKKNNAKANGSPVTPVVQSPIETPQPEFPSNVEIWKYDDEWNNWTQKSDPIFHLLLKRWADILVIAPLTANTLAKMVLGLCDNLLTNIIRAWNPAFPIFIAPSMVSSTYNSITTKKQLAMVKEDMPWVTIFQPSEKIMSMHGNIGLGGMMDINEIIDKVVMKLGGYPKDEEEEEQLNDDNNESTNENNQDDEDEDEDDDDDDDDDEDDDEDEDDEDEDDTIIPNHTQPNQ